MNGIDIGHDVTIFWMAQEIGIYWKHPGRCSLNWLKFYPNEESTGHKLISGGEMDMPNFTIRGSLLCPQCGFHGSIENGVWKPL
jgi:hypothetical protein